MDLLLIRPNDAKAIYGGISENAACEPPFWAAQIAAYCRSKNVSVTILDAEGYNMSPEEMIAKVKEFSPKLIGIIITGTNLSASTWKMNGASLCAKMIKSSANIPVFMWGLHSSALPVQTMEEEEIDFVMKGEGLDSIVSLVNHLGDLNAYDAMKGLYYRDVNGEIRGNQQLNLIDADALPAPAWDLLPMELYKAHNWQRFGEKESGPKGYAVIATSLGCPFQCSFCAVSALFGARKVRYLQPKTVISIIDELVNKYNVKYIKILDECFVLNMNHVEEICDLLIERDYDLNIWAYARVDTVNERILAKLKKAGIQWLAYGIESASELSLKDVSKGQYNLQNIKESMKITQDAGIHIMANFMFGLPEDTKETMEMTLALAKDINPEFINFYCTMAYPGSKLYHECIENNVKLPDSWIGYSEYSYESEPLPTKYLTSKEVLAFRDSAFENFFENNERYFQMIQKKFGEKTVQSIHEMLTRKMKRKLLEE